MIVNKSCAPNSKLLNERKIGRIQLFFDNKIDNEDSKFANFIF